MSFVQLPRELQEDILFYLTPFQLAETRLVCREWNSLSREPLETIRDLFVFTRSESPIKSSSFYLNNRSLIIKRFCRSQYVAALLKSIPKSLENLRAEMFADLVQNEEITLTGRENEVYEYDFTFLAQLILQQKSPINLHLEKLELVSEHLDFLDPLLEQQKIAQLSFTKDQVSAAKIQELKRKMEFFEDGIDEDARKPLSLLLFIRKDP